MILKFQNIMPALTDDEYKQLEENILADGIRDPLVLWGDVLIDGHNRYAIAQKHGLEFKTIQNEFANDTEAKIWIITNQLGRRNIPSTGTKAMLVLELEPLYKAQAKERQRAGYNQYSPVPPEGTRQTGKTRDQLAKIAKVGRASIDYARYIKAHATDEVIKKVESGEIPLKTAFNEIVKKNTPQKNDKPVAPIIPLTEKTCSICGRVLPIDKFYLKNGVPRSECKQCKIAKITYGISPTLREDIDAISQATNQLTDTERVIEYSIEDVIVPITEEVARFIRIIDSETKNHADLLKDPDNKAALLKALENGVCQIQEKIKNLARLV